MVKDCKKFLVMIKEIKLYFIEFRKDGIIKNKNYFSNCIIRVEN